MSNDPRPRAKSRTSSCSTADDDVDDGGLRSNRSVSPWLINVPHERTHVGDSFKNRDDFLGKVVGRLREHNICAICGLAGVGKTTVAVMLVHRLKETDYEVVFWINAASDETFEENLSNISNEICRRTSNFDGYDVSTSREVHIKEKVKTVKQWINRNSDELKILIVFDGCDDPSCFTNIMNLLPENRLSDRKLQVLVTSRQKNLTSLTVYKTETLEPLAEDEAVILLKRGARDRGVKWEDDHRETEAAHEINKIVGGVPLAVQQVIAYIGKQKMKLSLYLEQLQSSDYEHLPVEQPVHGNHRSDIYAVFERNFREVCTNDCAREMLGIISFSSVGHPIPLQLFSLGSTGLSERCALRQLSDRLLKDTRKLKRTDSRYVPPVYYERVSELEQYHLISLDSDNLTVTVHPLIRFLLRFRQKPNEQRDSISALSSMLATVFRGSPSDRWQLYSTLFPHVMECYRQMGKLDLYDTSFLLQTGKRLSLSGHFRESCQLLEECQLKMQQNVQKRRSFEEAETLSALASSKRRLGEFSAATRLTQQSLDICTTLSKTPYVSKLQAKTKERFAEILLDLEEFRQAEVLLKEVEPLIGANSSLTETCSADDIYEQTSFLGNLGRALAGQEKYDDAVEKFEQAANRLSRAEYFRFHLYKAHGLVAKTWKSVKGSEMDEFYRSFELCLQTLEEIRRHYGSRHRYHAWLCREIAKLRLAESRKLESKESKKGKLRLALELCHQTLEGHIELYKDGHTKVAKAAEVAARVCLEYSSCDIGVGESVKSHKAAFKCLQLARRTWLNIQKDMPLKNELTVVAERIRELEELESDTLLLVNEQQKIKFLTLPKRLGKQQNVNDLSVLAEDAVHAVDAVVNKSKIRPPSNLITWYMDLFVICAFAIMCLLLALLISWILPAPYKLA